MNEITKIHLGRQPFTISVDAHKALQEYLRAISRHMGGSDEDATDEVEIRMAELLTERGIAGHKVVLLKDVEYLKEQLGQPGDFGDENESKRLDDDKDGTKRLFRDTENGMVAGVCAGIANYFGIDPLIVRLIFIVFTFAGASSILLYIILWILVPEAKTTSDRLRMRGKSVTVDALKDVVEQADVKGVAKRAQHTATKGVSTILKVFVAIIGIALMIVGVGALLTLIAGSIYLSLNHGIIVPFNIFPIGTAETILVGTVLLAAAMLVLFLLFSGLAMVKRRWVLPGWGLGAIAAIFLTCLAVGIALAGSATPKIKDRYATAHNSRTYVLDKPFNKVKVIGKTYEYTDVRHIASDQYKIELRYLGKADTSNVIIKETAPGQLELNISGVKNDPSCKDQCIFGNRDLQVYIYTPAYQQVDSIADNGSLQVLPVYSDEN